MRGDYIERVFIENRNEVINYSECEGRRWSYREVLAARTLQHTVCKYRRHAKEDGMKGTRMVAGRRHVLKFNDPLSPVD